MLLLLPLPHAVLLLLPGAAAAAVLLLLRAYKKPMPLGPLKYFLLVPAAKAQAQRRACLYQ
jgi:hypothetical protein